MTLERWNSEIVGSAERPRAGARQMTKRLTRKQHAARIMAASLEHTAMCREQEKALDAAAPDSPEEIAAWRMTDATMRALTDAVAAQNRDYPPPPTIGKGRGKLG